MADTDSTTGAVFEGRTAPQHAADAAKAAAGIIYTTAEVAGVGYPSAVYEVLGELAVMAARLPQAFAQLDVVFAGWVEAGHVRVEDGEFVGDAPAAAAVVSTYLTDAAAAAQRLAQMLDLTHEALSGAAWQDTPTD